MSDKRTLWVVSGGDEAVPGIRRAREMGLNVVVSDANPAAPGFAWADDAVLASTYDVQETLKAVRSYVRGKRPVDGILCMAADVPVTVATVAAELGLPGIPVEAANLSRDKLMMKQRFVDEGIPVPWFAPVESAEQLASILRDREHELVVKPVDSRGARGVQRLSDRSDLRNAWAQARSESPTGRVMVEEFLRGAQVSTESILMDDAAYTPGFADRNYEFLDRFAPYVIENGGQQPSALAEDQQKAVARLAEQAGRAMGISRGVAKGDMIYTDGGPKVIEIAARLSGGWFCTDQIPLGTGVDFVAATVRLALGDEPSKEDLVPKYHRGVCIRYFFPPPGVVREIKGADLIDDEPWIHRMQFFCKPGDVLEPVTNHTKRAGFVITTGADRDEAVARAQEVVRTVEIVTGRHGECV